MPQDVDLKCLQKQSQTTKIGDSLDEYSFIAFLDTNSCLVLIGGNMG